VVEGEIERKEVWVLANASVECSKKSTAGELKKIYAFSLICKALQQGKTRGVKRRRRRRRG